MGEWSFKATAQAGYLVQTQHHCSASSIVTDHKPVFLMTVQILQIISIQGNIITLIAH
jgi:hypothetical protein